MVYYMDDRDLIHPDHWKHYKNLLRRVGLPDIRWHDLRSTYCTLLLKSDFHPKAISKLMGHAKELVTVDIYGDNSNIIPEEIPKLLAYMKDEMPLEGRQKDSGSRKIIGDKKCIHKNPGNQNKRSKNRCTNLIQYDIIKSAFT